MELLQSLFLLSKRIHHTLERTSFGRSGLKDQRLSVRNCRLRMDFARQDGCWNTYPQSCTISKWLPCPGKLSTWSWSSLWGLLGWRNTNVYDRRTCSSWEFMYVLKEQQNPQTDLCLAHETTDANTFASWGADLLKCTISTSQYFEQTNIFR